MRKVTIYTDGASRGNGKKDAIGAYGAMLLCDGHKKEISKAFKGVTNNAMELTAVIEALKCLKFKCSVIIFTDSTYISNAINKNWLKNWIANGWKTKSKKSVSNKELWVELVNLLETHNVEFKWVKGHSDNEGNARADELCNIAMDNFKC